MLSRSCDVKLSSLVQNVIVSESILDFLDDNDAASHHRCVESYLLRVTTTAAHSFLLLILLDLHPWSDSRAGFPTKGHSHIDVMNSIFSGKQSTLSSVSNKIAEKGEGFYVHKLQASTVRGRCQHMIKRDGDDNNHRFCNQDQRLLKYKIA